MLIVLWDWYLAAMDRLRVESLSFRCNLHKRLLPSLATYDLLFASLTLVEESLGLVINQQL